MLIPSRVFGDDTIGIDPVVAITALPGNNCVNPVIDESRPVLIGMIALRDSQWLTPTVFNQVGWSFALDGGERRIRCVRKTTEDFRQRHQQSCVCVIRTQ